MAGSNLTSGNGLDGVVILTQGAFGSLGSTNAGLAAAHTQIGFVGTQNSNIYQGSEADLAAILTASSGTTRQVIFAGPTAVPGDYALGSEVALGDRAAAERGELNNLSSLYEVVTTGYVQLVDGRLVSPTGAILSSRATFGSSTSVGTDVTSGQPLKFYTNHGLSSIDTVSADLSH